jgi:hypothetical protein
MQIKKLIALIIAITAGVTSCSNKQVASLSPVSPIPSREESPMPTEPALLGPEFSIHKPLFPGDTEVSGTGPYDLPIAVVDVTMMGEILGRGSIGSDGNFTISVTPPLIANHRIGIMLDEQASDQYTEEVLMQLKNFQGENMITLPRIGRIYEAASVEEDNS